MTIKKKIVCGKFHKTYTKVYWSLLLLNRLHHLTLSNQTAGVVSLA